MKIPPFKLERYFAKHEFRSPYLLCGSDCESFSVDDLLGFCPDAWDDLRSQWLGYTESTGSPRLREQIAKLYNKVTPDEILVHAGAQEAIFLFMNAVLEPGDHVIVHYPCYQSLLEVARVIGCETTQWETREADNWELDTEFLRKSLRPNTKAVVLNCPHNPTGYLMSQDKLREIVQLCQERNIILFSDEVYRFLEYDEKDRLPAVSDLYENGVSLGVMSKAFGLAGLRIGWVVTRNGGILREMAALKDYTSICNSAPSEFLATLALEHKEAILSRNLEIIKGNLNILNDFFRRHPAFFNWLPPKAGAIAFPSINMDMHVEEFCEDLLAKKGVLLLPSNYYDFWNKNFRIGFGRKNMAVCLEKVEEYIQENL